MLSKIFRKDKHGGLNILTFAIPLYIILIPVAMLGDFVYLLLILFDRFRNDLAMSWASDNVVIYYTHSLHKRIAYN